MKKLVACLVLVLCCCAASEAAEPAPVLRWGGDAEGGARADLDRQAGLPPLLRGLGAAPVADQLGPLGDERC